MDFDSTTIEIRNTLLYLQWIIENLEYIQNVENPSISIYSDGLDEIDTDLSFTPELGLCDNVLYRYLTQRDIDDMFESWEDFCGNLTYPCDDRADFINEVSVNLYLNPKRLSLIEHIIACLEMELELRRG